MFYLTMSLSQFDIPLLNCTTTFVLCAGTARRIAYMEPLRQIKIKTFIQLITTNVHHVDCASRNVLKEHYILISEKKAIIKKYCNTNKLNVFEFETIENISNYKILSDKLRNILNNIEGNAIIVFNYHPELYALLSSKTIGSIFLINKLIPPILKELNRINRSFEKLSILISSTNEHSRDINIDSFSKLLSANEPSDTLAKNIFEIFTGQGCISQ